jgi:nucleotidyltransferase substrate binding protein (TIGR01987 family)
MSYFVEHIDIENLLKARRRFEEFRQNISTDQNRAGAIQAFEFSYELAWKTIKRVLNKRGIEVASPRETFREAAINKLISDPKVWFAFIEKRNISSHTYDEEKVINVIAVFESFSAALTELVTNLQALHDTH